MYSMRETIKRILNEVLGVPEGVLESGEILYQEIEKRLKRLPQQIEEQKKTRFKTDLIILNFNVKKINFVFEFTETDNVDEIILVSMGFGSISIFSDEELKILHKFDENEMSLYLSIAGPEGTTRKDIVKFYRENKDKLISSIAHELGHYTNFRKQKYQNIKKMAEYAGITRTSFPFHPIQEFLHYTYFIHSVENITRPIEVASYMRSQGIDREKFYEFITNNATYQMLKRINEFSYEKMREQLRSQVDDIKTFIKNLGGNVKKFKTDDEVVDELLRIVYVNLANKSIETLKEMMTTNFLENLVGFQGDKGKLFDDMIGYFTKFETNYKKFYTQSEKDFKRISTKMMKKLIKLYELAKVNPQSIENWALHHKINRTGEQLETELKYRVSR